MALFDALKEKGYLVMIVSFNGASGFIRQPHERAEEAIMRQIVRQLIDRNAFTEHLQCTEKVFDAFLDQQTRYGSSQVPLIMLIDVKYIRSSFIVNCIEVVTTVIFAKE